MYILASGALGRPTIGHSRPRGGPTPAPLYPGVVPVGPGEVQLPVCLLHTDVYTILVVGFSLSNKNSEYMGKL